jgi:Protein of unknown function (DUF1194)
MGAWIGCRRAGDGRQLIGVIRTLVRAGSVACVVFLASLAVYSGSVALPEPTTADVALVVSVDVSESVDDARYTLQMEGIAAALEDPAVIATLTSGPKGRILFSMVVWADKSELAVPWVQIATKAEAFAVAGTVRHLKRYGGEFTCMARMFANIKDNVLPMLPVKADRVVLDVSGDGIDNCSADETTTKLRDELVKTGVMINGLPIIEEPGRIVGSGAYRAPGSPMEYLRPLEAREQLTLEDWYRTYVMGGEFAFILPANGYADFARAMRQKFVTEISMTRPSPIVLPDAIQRPAGLSQRGGPRPGRIAQR